VCLAACKGSVESTSTTTRPDPPPNTSTTPDPDPGESWQRGTITTGPDGMFAIHADDDSATVCAFELAPELQQNGLAVRFQAELIPPEPNERRWCTLAKTLKVERAE
jgi:hypothetical protein